MFRLVAFFLLSMFAFPADFPRLLRSVSGPSGRTVGHEFVLDEIRNRFVFPNDNSLVVYFQWDAPAGDHILTGIWKQPDGRVSQISPDVKIRTSTTALNCYWIFTLVPGLMNGVWSLDVRVDGAPAGTHSFEIAGMSAELLSVDQIFKSIGPSVVWIRKLDRMGTKFDLAMGFVIAPNAIATAFQAIDSAARLEIEFPDGRKVTTEDLFAYSRSGDWAVVKADTGASTPVSRGDVSKLLVGQRLAIFTFDSSTRVVGVVDIGGEGVIPGFGGRIQLTPESAPEAAGGPVLDSTGHVVGIVGGSRKPGARLSRLVLMGSREVRDTLVHGAGGTAINSATTIADVPSQIPANTKTLEKLTREGVLTPLLAPMAELVAAGTGNELRKRVSSGLPPETSEFTYRGPDVAVFSLWAKKGKISKGAVSLNVFDTSNKLRVTGKPKKISFARDPQELGFTFSPAPLEPGTYRIDLGCDGSPVWRTFIRITE